MKRPRINTEPPRSSAKRRARKVLRRPMMQRSSEYYTLPEPETINGKDVYHLTDEDMQQLMLEGMRQHLYLGGQPGTHNRLTLEKGKHGWYATVWTEKDKPMPAVSATHGWILWEIAKKRLEEAGYRVEKHGNRLAAYHGVGLTTCFPDFLSINNGKCSPRTVERLIKKLPQSSS